MTFARIGIFATDGRPLGPVVDLFRDKITPMFEAVDGFLGYQAFTDDRAGRYVGISYWRSLESLEASGDVAAAARDAAAKLGATIVGEPMIVRQHFDSRTG